MPIYTLQGPDGKTYKIEGPQGATAEQLAAFLQGGTDARQRRQAEQQAADRQRYDPTAGMSGGEKFLAGAGKALTDLGRGAGQLLGMVSREDADENARLDAPLMNTGAGLAGNIAGNVAAVLPSLFVPGAASIPGAAAIGAVQGALQPVGTDDSRLGNVALGGTLGGGSIVAGRALASGVQGTRALAEPFTQAGRTRIAGRTLERFAADPLSLARARGGQSITGATPTLAEQTADPGIATLQRALESADPQIAAQMQERLMGNNAARIQTLRSIAGEADAPVQTNVRRLRQIATSPTVEAATGTRAAAARQSYGQAFDEGIDPAAAEALAPQVASLMERPSVRAGVARARALAAEEGIDIQDAGSLQGLHYLKQSLDDMVGRLRDQPTRQRLVQQTSQDLASVLEEIAPAYQTARREFQNNSVAVNRAEVGRRLAETTQGALRDFSGNRRLQANAFARALNDEGRTIQQATGFRGAPQTLDDLMSPTQMGRINALRDELETVANLASAANGPGSQTAKTLSSQNLLRQILGPTGAPDSWAESALLTNLMRPVQFAYGTTEPRIQNQLAEILLNPELAEAALQAARPAQRQLPGAVNRLVPYAEQAIRQSVPAAGLVAGQR